MAGNTDLAYEYHATFALGVRAERNRMLAWLKTEAGEADPADMKSVMVAGVLAAIAADIERAG